MTEQERAIKRSIAIRQYRFLMKLAKIAREKKLYALDVQYRNEAQALKLAYNL